MSTWNYRTTVQRTEQGPIFAVREVYYGDDGSLSWTLESIAPTGDTWLELMDNLALMTRDASVQPILDITEEGNPAWVTRRLKPSPTPALAASSPPATTGAGTYRPCAGCDAVGDSCRAVGCPAASPPATDGDAAAYAMGVRDGIAAEVALREHYAATSPVATETGTPGPAAGGGDDE